jgi:replication factor A1
MLATQLNPLVASSQITTNSILTVKDFIINTMGSGQKVCILLNVEVNSVNPGNRIGSPQDIQKVGPNTTATVGGGMHRQGGAQPMYGNVQANNNGGGGMYGNNNQGGGNNPYSGGAPAGNPYGAKSNNNNAAAAGGGSAPIVRTTADGQPVTPISGLNMYSNRWVIRAKVTNKSDVKTWSNAKGEGSLFSVTLLDSSGYDVKCTFFKEAVDKFYNMLEEGRVYTFSGGRLKVANMAYNNCKSQFEITFDQNSEIHLDAEGAEIRENYDFVKIAELENMEPNSYVDILAVVKHVGDVSTIVSKKSGKEMTKVDLVVEDDSGADVKLTLWGNSAQNAENQFANCPVVAFKKSRLGDYGGRSLSGGSPTVNPQIPQTNQLMQWWGSNGNKSQSRSLSSSGGGKGPDPLEKRKDVCSIKEEHLGNSDKPDWLSFKATITFLKREKQGDDGAWYTACANSGEPCRNMFKATQTSDGNYHCDKCQQTHPNCVRRFIFSGTVADDTSTSWISMFNEQAETLFNGMTADNLYQQSIEQGDKDFYDSTFLKATYTEWVFKCKVKQEMVGDETRIKTSVASLVPVDYAKESRALLSSLLSQ